jgi:hypothetical protein
MNKKDNDTKIDVCFEACDCNDEGWNIIIAVLEKELKDFKTIYGEGNNMCFSFTKEDN